MVYQASWAPWAGRPGRRRTPWGAGAFLGEPASGHGEDRIETGLSYLRATADGLHIGALTPHRAIEMTGDPAVTAGFGVLPRSAPWIGHYPIRARGTFGGSIAHADPASEWCLLALLLEANVVLQGPAGQRVLPSAEFLQGYYTTAAAPDEMITEVWFPRPAQRAALTEFAERQGDFAVVAAAVAVDIADGVCGAGRRRPAAGHGRGRGPRRPAGRTRELARHGRACRQPDRAAVGHPWQQRLP